ncbi:MAG: hypothetical protein IJW21_01160, partial [Clostridia bacterium]|nr:hypothetical protein [Clostridia bacterium]
METGKYISRCGKTAAGADFTELSGVPYFSAAQTFDCGQCFRFDEADGGVQGVAFGKLIRIEQEGDTVRLIGV